MNWRVSILFLISIVLLASGSAWTQDDPATQKSGPSKLTVAVLDFDADTPNVPNLGKQIGETLTTMLSTDSGFTLVDRASLARVLQEHQLALTGLAKPEDAVRIGHLVGAKLLITGKAFALDKNIYITAKLIGTETSLVDGVLIKDKQDAEVGSLVAQLSAKLAERIRTKGSTLIAAPDAPDPIPALRAKLAGRKLPRLAISVTETHYGEFDGKPIDPAVETELRSVLKQVGFEIVDPDAARVANRHVDVVIKGQAFSEFSAHIGNLVTCTACAEIELRSEKSGAVILSDRATTRAADLSEQIAGKTCLEMAGHDLALRIAQHFINQPATTASTK